MLGETTFKTGETFNLRDASLPLTYIGAGSEAAFAWEVHQPTAGRGSVQETDSFRAGGGYG